MSDWTEWRQPQKRPVKVNLFQQLVGHAGQIELMPVFPYLGPGDIVVGASRLVGGPELQEFTFLHRNVVPETMVVLAEEGGSLPTGSILALLGEHAVASNGLTNPSDPRSYLYCLVAIRINFDARQEEAVVLQCPQCGGEAFRYEFDIKTGPERPYVPEFRGLYYYDEAARRFNATDRRCPHCQAELPPFPREQMGWSRYAENVEVANRGKARMAEAFRGLGAVTTA